MDFKINGLIYNTPTAEPEEFEDNIIDGFISPKNLHAEIVGKSYYIICNYDRMTFDILYDQRKNVGNKYFIVKSILFKDKDDYDYFKTKFIRIFNPNIRINADNYNMRFIFADYKFRDKIQPMQNSINVDWDHTNW